jgi:hypothetical protein
MIQVMQLFLSKKKLIILSSVLVILILGIWVWFFGFRERVNTPSVTLPEIPAVQQSPDDIRIRHLELIKKSIQAALARGLKLPLPEDVVKIDFNGVNLLYQGKTSTALYDMLWLNTLVDPKTEEQYVYSISSDGLKYQIIAVLDNALRGNSTLGPTIYSVGDPELSMTDIQGQLLRRDTTGSDIDLAMSPVRTKLWLPTLKSCQDFYTLQSVYMLPPSWVYTIDIDGRETKVFCDMQTDGGWWTLFYANNGHEDSPIQKSYVQMRETMTTDPVSDLSNYDDPNLVGLLDFHSFISQGSKEVLIRNRTWDEKKWVKFTFSTSYVLDWALWSTVLGTTDTWCIDIPRRGTWSIQNNDKKILYTNLKQMMNHRGTSWGVSHDKFPCNEFEKWANPHIGFYSAIDNKSSGRTRSNDGIGGKWGEGGEYRYFIR